jgi:prepilin peptidase CpaA
MALAIGLAATTEDLACRRISNWIPLAALVLGLSYQGITAGWSGIGTAALGSICGFGVFLVFYLLGGMGGGDVKLMAGFGALLGPARLGEAALWTAGLGGLFALSVIGFRQLRQLWRGAQSGGIADEKNSIPYAPAISLGALLALLPKS